MLLQFVKSRPFITGDNYLGHSTHFTRPLCVASWKQGRVSATRQVTAYLTIPPGSLTKKLNKASVNKQVLFAPEVEHSNPVYNIRVHTGGVTVASA